MKKFKQFRSEQQYITEVGPYASAFMGAMGVIGLGMAGFKLFKSAKEKIKGYRETKAEKKDNKEAGVFIDKKIFNPETGKEETETIPLHEPGSGKAGTFKLGILIKSITGKQENNYERILNNEKSCKRKIKSITTQKSLKCPD